MVRISRIDLETAWMRTKADIDEQYCLSNPYAVELADMDTEGWLDMVRLKLRNGTYRPSPSETIDLPKADWHVRRGTLLSLEDILVYEALVLDCSQAIRNRIDWSAMNKRFSCILCHENRWFLNEVRTWNQFKQRSLERIDAGARYVVYGDVSGFFDSIDHQLLMRDLRDAGVERQTCHLLSECLRCWLQPIPRGVPQNLRPSHLLADLYMDKVDRQLSREGFDHLRYVDDIKIFCLSEREARMALRALTNMLRDIGLNVQTAKTYISTASEARDDIGLVGGLIREIDGSLSDELSVPYGSLQDMEQFADIVKANPDLNALRRAFGRYFLNNEISFNKHLFHFVINRLGIAGDDTAVEYCLDLLLEHPEETVHILDGYFSKLEDESLSDYLAGYVLSDDIIYDYQIFLIMKWLHRYGMPTDAVLQAARHIAMSNIPEYIRNYGFAILGEWGDEEDHTDMIHCYNGLSSEMSCATVIYSLQGMASSRRDIFYGTVREDGWFIERAVRRAESSEPAYYYDITETLDS